MQIREISGGPWDDTEDDHYAARNVGGEGLIRVYSLDSIDRKEADAVLGPQINLDDLLNHRIQSRQSCPPERQDSEQRVSQCKSVRLYAITHPNCDK